MGMLMDGFNTLVEMERQYGDTPEGVVLLDGVVSEVIGVLPNPFPLGLFGIELAHTSLNTLVGNVRGLIRTYLAAGTAV